MNLFRWKYQFAAVMGRGHAAPQAQHECQHFHVGQVVKPAADCQIGHERPFGLTIGAMNLLPRRNFFASVRNLVAAGGVLGQFRPAQAAAIDRGEDYYDKLGVTKIINAAGTYTALTASIMPPSVQAAVARAAEHPVRLADLQKAAGEYLAKKLKCEAALVTAGAASALTLGTAACIMVANKCGIRAIPNEVSGLKNEVIIQKAHRYGYDQAVLCCGVKFVEVETLAAVRGGLQRPHRDGPFLQRRREGPDQPRRLDPRGARPQRPLPSTTPPPTCRRSPTSGTTPRWASTWSRFSGGKGIRGPQNAGLLLGKKDLIAARCHEQQSQRRRRPRHEGCQGTDRRHGRRRGLAPLPNRRRHGKGIPPPRRQDRRPAQGHARRCRRKSRFRQLANHVPHLLIRYDQDKIKIAPRDVMAELRKGTPSIELNPSTGSNSGSFRRHDHRRQHHRSRSVDAPARRGDDRSQAPARSSLQGSARLMDPFRLITLDPGHFHAALIQKEMYAGVSHRASPFTRPRDRSHRAPEPRRPLQSPPQNPTRWEMDVHAAPDFLERMLRRRPAMSSCSPAAIAPRSTTSAPRWMPVCTCWPTSRGSSARPTCRSSKKLSTAAQAKGLVAYDIMTERYEITSILQRELVNDPGIFGAILPGTEQSRPSTWRASTTS